MIRPILRAATIALGLSMAQPCFASLMIVKTFRDPLDAIKEVVRLQATTKWKFVLRKSGECKNLRPGYFLVTLIDPVPPFEARAISSDAYEVECDLDPTYVTNDSISPVDNSFSESAGYGVNWGPADIVVRNIDGVLIVPYFVKITEDVREGLRQSVQIIEPTKNPMVFVKDCTAAQVARAGRYLAIACARESIADQSIFELKLFKLPSTEPVMSVARCTRPMFNKTGKLICLRQEIGMTGTVVLQKKTISIAH